MNVNVNNEHNMVEPNTSQQFDSLRLVLNDNNSQLMNDNFSINGMYLWYSLLTLIIL